MYVAPRSSRQATPVRRWAALRLASTAALALTLAGCLSTTPHLKEGFWEIHGQGVENPSGKRTDFSYRLCRDHAFDRRADAKLQAVKGCETQVKRLEGNKYSSASTCAVGGTTVVSNAVVAYQGDTKVHSDSHAAYSPPLNGKTDETLTQDQSYVGKCPPGTKAGDTVTPDGIVLHHED